MDPHYRSRLIAVVITMIAVCSAFSVSPVAGFRVENRDGSSTGAVLAESLVLQESTRINEAFLENVTVYIDSDSEKFDPFRNTPREGVVNGIYSPEEDAVYLRSDIHPERADEALVNQIGHRVYIRSGLAESTVLQALIPGPESNLSRIGLLHGGATAEDIFANAFMLYYRSPETLKADHPQLHAYIDLLVSSGGDAAAVDELYTRRLSK